MSWRQPFSRVEWVNAVHAVIVPPNAGALFCAGHRIWGRPLEWANVDAWCQSVPSSPWYFGKNSVRQHNRSGPRMEDTRSTIACCMMCSLSRSMSRCRS